MRFLLICFLISGIFYQQFLQETSCCNYLSCIQSNSDIIIESTAKKITIYFEARYSCIDNYIKENIKFSNSPSYKERKQEIFDLFNSKYETLVKSIVYSFGLNAKSGIFVVNSKGKIEALTLIFANENTCILSNANARDLFYKLYTTINFPTWEDDTDIKSVCVTVKLN